MIFVIGDSHSCLFSGTSIIDGNNVDPNFTSKRIGPYTAYNIHGKKYDVLKTIELLNVNKLSDYIFFSFGEIDVRCHIGFITDQQSVSYKKIVNECVDRYVDFLQFFQTQNYKIGVWGVIPSGSNNSIQGNGRESYKTAQERNVITSHFNHILKQKCEVLGIKFKCIFNHIVNDASNYDSYYTNDNTDNKMHLNYDACKKLIYQEFSDIIYNENRN